MRATPLHQLERWIQSWARGLQRRFRSTIWVKSRRRTGKTSRNISRQSRLVIRVPKLPNFTETSSMRARLRSKSMQVTKSRSSIKMGNCLILPAATYFAFMRLSTICMTSIWPTHVALAQPKISPRKKQSRKSRTSKDWWKNWSRRIWVWRSLWAS